MQQDSAFQLFPATGAAETPGIADVEGRIAREFILLAIMS